MFLPTLLLRVWCRVSRRWRGTGRRAARTAAASGTGSRSARACRTSTRSRSGGQTARTTLGAVGTAGRCEAAEE